MENNGWKFGIFGIIVLIIAIGGFFLTKQSFPESDIVNIPKVKTEKKKDIRLDKDKEYIYFENNDRVVDDLDIEYKDIIINFKEKNGIQDKLNNETAELKKTAVFDEEMEDEDFDKLVSATYKTYDSFIYEDYISLLVNYYKFDREDFISFVDSDTYIFNKKDGSLLDTDTILGVYNLTKEDVNNKIKEFVEGKNLLTEDELDANATIGEIKDYALFIDRIGRLSISILVKSDQKDYNEVVLLS